MVSDACASTVPPIAATSSWTVPSSSSRSTRGAHPSSSLGGYVRRRGRSRRRGTSPPCAAGAQLPAPARDRDDPRGDTADDDEKCCPPGGPPSRHPLHGSDGGS